jgi:hypothetical protein
VDDGCGEGWGGGGTVAFGDGRDGVRSREPPPSNLLCESRSHRYRNRASPHACSNIPNRETGLAHYSPQQTGRAFHIQRVCPLVVAARSSGKQPQDYDTSSLESRKHAAPI